MELSDCGSPEGLAQIIHTHIPPRKDGSTDLKTVAIAVGITKIESCDNPAYEGLLITDAAKSKGIILYNSNSNALRKRFTVAHELGHFLIPSHNGENANCASSDLKAINSKSPNSKKEAEANRFAIELLAPKKQINACLKPHREPDTQQILDIHTQFKISKEAAARRYIECTDHSVAIVFGKIKTIRYVLRSNDFPYIIFNNGDIVPEHIWQQVNDKQSGDNIDWYSVDPHYFLSKPKDANGKELFCQSSIQKNGFHMSLLSLDDE